LSGTAVLREKNRGLRFSWYRQTGPGIQLATLSWITGLFVWGEVMRKIFIIVFLATIIQTHALADNLAFESLMGAKCLRCEFGSGAVGDWKGGKVRVKLDKWRSSDPLILDSIDLKNGKARIIGSQGAFDIFILPTSVGLTFVEVTGSGNSVFRTVFAEYKKGGTEFIAVMSRHMNLPGGPLNSQYHGTCRILEKRP
jgi:hypothetical protein